MRVRYGKSVHGALLETIRVKRVALRLIAVCVLIVFAAALSFAQQLDTSPGARTGKLSSGSYFSAGLDSIGIYNGNVALDIPLLSLPGREISTNLRLTYNSQKWQEFNFVGLLTGVYTGGWGMFSPVGNYDYFYPQDLGCVDDLEYWVLDAYWIDGLGTKRRYTSGEFTTSCTETNPFANLVLGSVNGDVSTMLLDSSGNAATITFKDGSTIDIASATFRTSNGNFVAWGLNDDTLGRTSTTYTTNGPSTSEYYRRVTVKDANGSDQIYELHYIDHVAVLNPWLHSTVYIDNRLNSIVLPNSKQYSFEYDHDQGFLTRVTLPTGGYIRYVYPSTETDAANDYAIERRVSVDGSTEQVWTYTRSNVSGTAWWVTVGSPEGSVVVHKFDSNGQETETDWKASSGSGTIDRKVETTWTNDGVDSGNGQPINPRATLITTTLGSVKKTTALHYNSWHDVDEQYDSDWYGVSASSIPLTCTITTYNVQGVQRRVSALDVYEWDGSSCGTLLSKTEWTFDEWTPASTSGDPVPGRSAPYGARMNVTTIRRFTSASTYMDEVFHYDDLGNVVSHTMPGSLTSTISYADQYGSAGSNDTFAFPTTMTDPLGLTSTAVYNYDTGLPVSETDERGLTTSQTYDGMNRGLTVTVPSGISSPSTLVTSYDYDDDARKVTVSAAVTSGLNHTSEAYFDKLYRPIETVEKDPAGDVVMDTVYDGNGRAYRTSVPYRGGTSDSTTVTFDALDRPVTIVNPDSTTVTYSYNGNVTTVTDEAGNARRTTVNALGQLTRVEEPNPTLSSPVETDYTYYLTGGLASVTQSSQTRTYTRDFLGRLMGETHPETGATSYSYDGAGRLDERADARGVAATYGYDNDSRLTSVSYNDGTPAVTRNYSVSSTATAYLQSMTDAAGTVAYTYNSAGNLASEARAFSGVSGTFTTSYAYDAEGKLTSVTYPSGRVVAASYANGSGLATGRLSTLTDSTTSTTLLGSIADNAAGQITSQTIGGGTVTETRSFNSRFQLTGTTAAVSGSPVLALGFGYGDSNNGKIRSRTDSLQPEHSVDYSYDAVQRLSEVNAVSPAWSINWEYDVYGNRTSQTRTGLTTGLVAAQSPTYTNNQDNALAGYLDNAGNILTDGTHPLAYDGEGRLKNVSSGGITYIYDGDGRRVERIVSGGDTTYYLYGLTGLMSEFSTSSTNSSATAAASTDRLKYRIPEQTGTGVLTIAADGTVLDNNRVLPFGEQWSTADASNMEKFTTYQRDTATGLDYAMARDYARFFGRFMSPDPGHIGADPGDPQSWNAYVYGGNDSINHTDPSGEYYILCPNGASCVELSDIAFAQLRSNLDRGEGLWDGVIHLFLDGRWKDAGYYSQLDVDLPPGVQNALHTAGVGADKILKTAIKVSVVTGVVAGAVTWAVGLTAGSGLTTLEIGQNVAKTVPDILSKAATTVGNQSIRAANRQIAEQAAKEWVGKDAQTIVDRASGEQVGWKNFDGTKIVRFTSVNKAAPYINFVNKITGGNLHVYF